MSKMMLTRASTVVLKNRRRYSMRTRHGRPRRQSAPTVLQRAPPSPRGFSPASPTPGARGYPGCPPSPARGMHVSGGGDPRLSPAARGGGAAFTYPCPLHAGGGVHVDKSAGRRGSLQPLQLQGRAGLHTGGVCHCSTAAAGAGGGGGGTLTPHSCRSSSPFSSSSHAGAGNANLTTSSCSSNAATVASANAALREVTVDSPRLRRITFQDWRRQKEEELENSGHGHSHSHSTTSASLHYHGYGRGSEHSRPSGRLAVPSPSGQQPSETLGSRSRSFGAGRGEGGGDAGPPVEEYRSSLVVASTPCTCEAGGSATGVRSVQVLVDYGDARCHLLKVGVFFPSWWWSK